MCYGAEAAWVPYVIAAVGAGASAYQQHQVARNQDQQAAINIQNQAQDQQQANQKVQSAVNAMKNSSPDAARSQAAQAFVDQLQRARAQSTQDNMVGANKRYAEDTSAANAKTNAASSLAANNLATIQGANLQRTAENQGQAQLASDLGVIGNNAASDEFLGQLRLRGITPNPWVSAIASGLEGYGMGAASNAGGTPTKKKAPSSWMDYSAPSAGYAYG